MGVGKGIGMGFFATPLAHLIPGGHLDGQHHHLRQKLVEGALQTVAVAHERLSRVERRGELGSTGRVGGVLGLWVTGLSGWARAITQKEARPTTEMSIVLKILTSRFADHREAVLVRVPMDEGGGG